MIYIFLNLAFSLGLRNSLAGLWESHAGKIVGFIFDSPYRRIWNRKTNCCGIYLSILLQYWFTWHVQVSSWSLVHHSHTVRNWILIKGGDFSGLRGPPVLMQIRSCLLLLTKASVHIPCDPNSTQFWELDTSFLSHLHRKTLKICQK